MEIEVRDVALHVDEERALQFRVLPHNPGGKYDSEVRRDELDEACSVFRVLVVPVCVRRREGRGGGVVDINSVH